MLTKAEAQVLLALLAEFMPYGDAILNPDELKALQQLRHIATDGND